MQKKEKIGGKYMKGERRFLEQLSYETNVEWGKKESLSS